MEITHKYCFLFSGYIFTMFYLIYLVYSYLFGVRTCVSILWHASLSKNATFAWKNSEKPWFGDFWWFSCFWHDVTYDVTVASYKVCLYFFWYQWIREGYSYPLVLNTWCFVNRFPRSWGGGISPPAPPRLWDGSKKPGSFRVKGLAMNFSGQGTLINHFQKQGKIHINQKKQQHSH